MASGEAKKTVNSADVVASAVQTARAGSEVLPQRSISAMTTNRIAPTFDVDTRLIIVRKRKRPINEARVGALVIAIQETGFFGSILIRPIPGEEGETHYALVIGAHRWAAMRRLGLAIPAQIRALTDDEAEQIEIDENLIRSDLTPLEKGVFLMDRFAVFQRRFPDRVTVAEGAATVKRGRPNNSDKMSQFLDGRSPTMGFAEDTAAEIGVDRRTIERAWTMINGIPAGLRPRLHGTPIAKNAALLQQIAGVSDRAEQLRIVEALTDGRATKFADAQVYASGKTPVAAPKAPVDAWLKTVQKLWKAAPASHRAAFLEQLSGQSLPAGWSVTKAVADE